MKKHSTSDSSAPFSSLPLETVDLSESMVDHRFVSWLSQYGLLALAALLTILVGSLLIYKVSFGATQKSEQDFIKADNYFTIFQGNAKESLDVAAAQDALNQLKALIQKHPELHAKYDGLIAQTLLNRNEIAQAQEFANLAIARTASENDPFYSDYAKTTLLIGEQNYQDSLTRALALQQQMEESISSLNVKPAGEALFALNLLRIGMLQQQQGILAEELKTWNKWDAWLAQNKNFAAQLDQFGEGKISLLHYINARKKALAALN